MRGVGVKVRLGAKLYSDWRLPERVVLINNIHSASNNQRESDLLNHVATARAHPFLSK